MPRALRAVGKAGDASAFCKRAEQFYGQYFAGNVGNRRRDEQARVVRESFRDRLRYIFALFREYYVEGDYARFLQMEQRAQDGVVFPCRGNDFAALFYGAEDSEVERFGTVFGKRRAIGRATEHAGEGFSALRNDAFARKSESVSASAGVGGKVAYNRFRGVRNGSGFESARGGVIEIYHTVSPLRTKIFVR